LLLTAEPAPAAYGLAGGSNPGWRYFIRRDSDLNSGDAPFRHRPSWLLCIRTFRSKGSKCCPTAREVKAGAGGSIRSKIWKSPFYQTTLVEQDVSVAGELAGRA
jgi:hypothetical protein